MVEEEKETVAIDKPSEIGVNTVNKTGKDPITGKFVKGNSASPGHPKGQRHFATIFKELLREEIQLKDFNGKPIKMTLSKAMSTAMARKAIRGDVNAFNAVADRVDGKPSQEMNLEISTPPVPIYSSRSVKIVKMKNETRENKS